MKRQFTPGPWEFKTTKLGGMLMVGPEGGDDLYLASKAPEMYALLVEMREASSSNAIVTVREKIERLLRELEETK
jgi:hypothetical protein